MTKLYKTQLGLVSPYKAGNDERKDISFVRLSVIDGWILPISSKNIKKFNFPIYFFSSKKLNQLKSILKLINYIAVPYQLFKTSFDKIINICNDLM